MVAAIDIDTGGAKHVLGLRGRDGERGHGASHARQPDRARSRSRTASALHRRRRQGALEGDPADLRAGGGPPALPAAQGAQHHGPAGREASMRRQEGLAAGLSRTTRRPNGSCALARRQHDAPGVSGSILEGLDEILTVIGSASRRNFDTRGLPNAIPRSAPDGAAERQALCATRDGAALDRRRPLGGVKDLNAASSLPPAPRP